MFNLVIVLFVTFGLALLLVYFISAHDRKHKQPQGEPLTSDAFKLFAKFCVDLCESLKLEVKEFTQHPPHELTLKAVNVNPITRVEYLVMGIFAAPTDTIDAATVAAFSDQIISERIAKGILITPATISAAAKSLPELAPIDFVDGAKYLELQKKIIL